MPRLNPVNPNTAQGAAKLLLDGVQKSFGMTPNLMRTLANSPAALEAYLGLLKALGGAGIDAKTRESILRRSRMTWEQGRSREQSTPRSSV